MSIQWVCTASRYVDTVSVYCTQVCGAWYMIRHVCISIHVLLDSRSAMKSAAYFKSVTRDNILRNNVFHDGPRSG
jgi:hypothetical protein